MRHPGITLLAAMFLSVAQAAEVPRDVISLAPNLTLMVSALGAADRLLGVTPFCEAPAAAQRLPGGLQPEPEDVFALHPALVLATSMTPAATRRQLTDLGLRVEVVDATSLEGIRRAMTRLAALLGMPPPVRPAAARLPSERKSVVLLFGADTGYSAGRGTHAHEILEAAGLRNIAADAGGPWPQLGDELILAADPEIIIVADYGSSTREQILSALRAHPVRHHLHAVRHGRVFSFPAPAFSVPGPAALEAADQLRAQLESP